jgi:myosin heavy subunit
MTQKTAVDNLIMLTEESVNEDGILECLKTRYTSDKIYVIFSLSHSRLLLEMF